MTLAEIFAGLDEELTGLADGGRASVLLDELERCARIEARRDQFLKDSSAFELRHWDEELGWAVLLWDPDTSDGEPPPPSFDDFSDREHNQDYHAALEAALDKAGAP